MAEVVAFVKKVGPVDLSPGEVLRMPTEHQIRRILRGALPD